jgi:hypothetical protein
MTSMMKARRQSAHQQDRDRMRRPAAVDVNDESKTSKRAPAGPGPHAQTGGRARAGAQVEDDAAAPAHWALVKGAPEVVRGFLRAPPPEYDATYRAFAAQGGRCARPRGHASHSCRCQRSAVHAMHCNLCDARLTSVNRAPRQQRARKRPPALGCQVVGLLNSASRMELCYDIVASRTGTCCARCST